MATYKAVLNNKPKSDKTYTILIRITHNRKLKHISVGHSVKEKDFNPNKNDAWVKSSYPDSEIINQAISNKIHEAKEYVSKLPSDIIVSSTLIKQRLKGGFSPSFFEYAEKSLAKRLKTRKSIKYGKMMQTTLNKLQQFLKGRNLSFSDLNLTLLNDFEIYLIEKNNKVSTINTNFKKIRAITNEAVRENILEQDKNPFLKYKFKKETTNKAKLSLEEVQKIKELDLEVKSSVWHTRNYFMFSYYCAGIRAADFIKLKWKNIVETERIENNKKVKEKRLVYQMGKNDKFQDIILVKPALDILKYYKPQMIHPEEYIFPLLSNEIKYSDLQLFNQVSSKNALINKYLKIIAIKAKISKNLSFHIARHSFADNARKQGASVYDISKALNHSSIRITERYLASFDCEAKDNLLNKMFSGEF